jgi:hypothetical protein
MSTYTNENKILLKYFYSLAPKCIDSLVLEFVVSNTTGDNQWGKCISSLIGEINRSTWRKPLPSHTEKWKLNYNALIPFLQEQREMKDIMDESPKFNH